MTFSPPQLTIIADMWNAGKTPIDIAMKLRGNITDQDVREQLRKMDLKRATRPEPKAPTPQ